MSRARRPEGLLLAYYGDDFTGSTDVMEVLAFAGLPTALFLAPPTPERLARFGDLAAVGIAGVSRSKPPAWMDAELPAVFRSLQALGAELVQYKVCSTFDSSPQIGSIGRALEIGLETLGADWASMLVAAPALRRYQVFGNLFAGVGGVGHRLDRHPTMAHHPVTPMTEADLRLHLARQTALPSALADILALQAGQGEAALAAARGRGARAVLFDSLDEASLAEAGRLIWQSRGDSGFSVSSSGLQYALTAAWRAAGLLPPPTARPRLEPVARLLAVSGSCSPVTAGQIDWAEARGWALLRVEGERLLEPQAAAAAEEEMAGRCLDALAQGRDPLVFTARGPDDPAIAAFGRAWRSAGRDPAEANEALGRFLGAVARRVQAEAGLRRLVVAGGDTSGQVAQALGIHALTAEAPAAPGAPLCRVWSDAPAVDGLSIVLKGGQVGGPDFFGIVKAGGRD